MRPLVLLRRERCLARDVYCLVAQRMDRRFLEGTTEQLRLMGLDWGAVWLRQEELEVVSQLQSRG
jgi:hypothetical protein